MSNLDTIQDAQVFKITCSIENQWEIAKAEGGTKRIIAGRASGTNLDLDGEKMAKSVITSFSEAIESGIYYTDGTWSQLPLQAGHRAEWPGDTLGWIVKADVDANFDLWIEAELDTVNPAAEFLWTKLTTPKEDGRPFRQGFSVGGLVVKAGQEWDDGLKKFVRVFHEVALREISIVTQPANPTAYVQALTKSVDWNRVRSHSTTLIEEDMRIMTKSINPLEAPPTTEVVKTEELAQVAEIVVKAEGASPDETTEKSVELVVADAVVTKKTIEPVPSNLEKADARLSAVVDQLHQIIEVVDVLSKQVALLSKTPGDAVAEVVKAATEPETEIAKAAPAVETSAVVKVVETEEDVMTKATNHLASTLKDLLAEALAPVIQRMSTLEAEPIDKSFSVSKADELAAASTTNVDRIRAELDTLPESERLGAALKHAFQLN